MWVLSRVPWFVQMTFLVEDIRFFCSFCFHFFSLLCEFMEKFDILDFPFRRDYSIPWKKTRTSRKRDLEKWQERLQFWEWTRSRSAGDTRPCKRWKLHSGKKTRDTKMMLLPWRQQLPRDWATFKDTKCEMLRVLFLFVFNLHPPQFPTLYFVRLL